MRKRVGDTLIEVTLAIGIFSLVAITIVAVMNGGTSSTQNALETTLAREEIDAQAEAIRFIHDVYIAEVDSDSDDNNTPYVTLWRNMVGNAVDLENDDVDDLANLTSATSCNAIYDGDEFLSKRAFVINPRLLSDPDSAFVGYDDGILTATTTYPRLIFGDNDNTNALVAGKSLDTNLKYAEGIYVIPVKDNKTTTLIGEGKTAEKTSAYYDFYIRTCWYGVGDETPSSIATIVRLYDPDALASSTVKTASLVKILYNIGSGATVDGETSMPSYRLSAGGERTIQKPSDPVKYGYQFDGWSIASNAMFVNTNPWGGYTINGVRIQCDTNECTFTAPSSLSKTVKLTIKANWTRLAHKIAYDLGEKGVGPKESWCYLDEYNPEIGCQISSTTPSYVGRDFGGYTTTKGSKTPEYWPGDYIKGLSTDSPQDVTLYAIWVYHPDTVFLLDSTGSMSSMIKMSREGIKKVAKETLDLGGKVALYDYRDYDDNGYKTPKLRCQFGGCTADNIGNYVDGITVGGGGDEPESLLSALMYVMDNLNWNKKYSKAIIVVTDATYLSPDRDGVKYQDVIDEANQLEPLKIFVVTTDNINNKGTYNSLTKDTGGKVVTSFDNLNDIITE